MYSREGAGFTEFLQAEQSLPLFGMRGRAVARRRRGHGCRRGRSRRAPLALRAEAGGAVARLVAEQERRQAADAQIREIERLIEILRTREREGEGSRFDRLRAEQELRDARQASTAAAVAVAEARAAICRHAAARHVDRRTRRRDAGADGPALPRSTR